jgi:hypothetical protein
MTPYTRRRELSVPWATEPAAEFDAWFDGLSPEDKEHIVAAVIYLEETGPTARMPMSYPIKQPNRCGMKELRPASGGRTEIRILYAAEDKTPPATEKKRGRKGG